jgi:hypothetical protein
MIQVLVHHSLSGELGIRVVVFAFVVYWVMDLWIYLDGLVDLLGWTSELMVIYVIYIVMRAIYVMDVRYM